MKNRRAIKFSILFMVILFSLIFRWTGISTFYTTIFAIFFGLFGVAILIFISKRKGKMIHCISYCPVGTIVNYFRWVNPFRLKVNNNCTMCLKCTGLCKYDALYQSDLQDKKPDITCTLCGDCLAGCDHNALEYHFLNMKPETARSFYLFITISFHAVFFALARL